MSSGWLQWIILSGLTGSPVGSAVALLVFWFVVDRFTLGVLPDPLRWVMRWRRTQALEHTLVLNPHDRRSRLELAGLLVDRKRYQRAVEVLKPNLEAGEDDVASVFTLGHACVGAGFFDQGEKLLAHARELSPQYRVGEIDLVAARFRLQRKDFKGAKEALERLLAIRKGSVEGRVLLAQALKGLGDDGAAALMRDQAWAEFVVSPRFQRKQERRWAWRARPSRPLAYLAVVLLALFLVLRFVAPDASAWAQQQRHHGSYGADDQGE